MIKEMNKNTLSFLKQKALNLRIDSIRATTAANSGHPTSCLSAADVISALYFHIMKLDVSNPKSLTNDRFILSKGHAIPVVYAAFKQLGIISDEELLSLRSFSSPLEGHPTPRFAHNEAATGSLGQGLPIAVGMALGMRQEKSDARVYVMMGDSEMSEGSVWEGLALAAHYKLSNLVGIIDCNRLGQTGESLDSHNFEMYAEKIKAFGWNAIIINGHDISEIVDALSSAQRRHDKPTMIIAKTYKGYGLENISNKNGFHGKPLTKEQMHEALSELTKRFKIEEDVEILSEKTLSNKAISQKIKPEYISFDLENDPNGHLFNKGSKIATRKAYGYGLIEAGRRFPQTIVLDAEVKNSTFSELFEKEFSDRFIQCFIAEQAMMSMATGLELCGKKPFASTFGAFISRAFDQLRMAGIGRNALRICGSHCGVSIGEDGPSQMALEDIAMIRTIPNSIVLYPSDGVSAYKCVELSANYHDGLSYIRTTRQDTPIIYEKNTQFSIGGSHVLRSSSTDKACLVAAGITLHEALKAYEALKNEGMNVSVIDLYSIKPLDEKTLVNLAKRSHNTLITIEDHYEAGGIGEAVKTACTNYAFRIHSLSVRNLSRSGKPQELLKFAEIDSEAIVKKVKEAIKEIHYEKSSNYYSLSLPLANQ